MDQRLPNTWRMTINEKNFITAALQSNLRADGRGPFDFRGLVIKFGREDGSSEVQLGHTRVLSFVTSQLVEPYRDRPNEGILSIFIEFSPMADPSFETGRPGESAVEVVRIIDRGLRESRAVDTETLCIFAGKLVWAIRIDIHILDNGGNIVDASNIAALASLLTFRRPECSLGGENGQEVIVHSPEAREPLPLIVHHLPIAVTFGFIGSENHMVIDPTHFEEAVMGGKITATLNANGDVCAIQKGGGVGVLQSVIMHCLRIASVKASDITSKIKNAVESHNTERTLRKMKRQPTSLATDIRARENEKKNLGQTMANEVSCSSRLERIKLSSEDNGGDVNGRTQSEQGRTGRKISTIGGPKNWDPYSTCFDSDSLRASLALRQNTGNANAQKPIGDEVKIQEPLVGISSTAANETPKTLKDAVKPLSKRRKKGLSKAHGK